jgi:uncharacterized protein YjbI with pentapeptide repeats
MLAAMFSGRHELIPDKEGAYFIDRDGTHFRYILNYLRDGDAAYIPNDKMVLEELFREANFYQLGGLSNVIKELLTPQVSEREAMIELGLQTYTAKFLTGTPLCECTIDSHSTREPSFKEKCIVDVSFRRIRFECQLSFRNSTLKNVLFEECYFLHKLDFSGADLTDVVFRRCFLGPMKMFVVVGATKDGITFDIPEFKDKLFF